MRKTEKNGASLNYFNLGVDIFKRFCYYMQALKNNFGGKDYVNIYA